TANAGDVVQIANAGDEVLAQAEVDAAFGAGAALGEMVMAAIRAVLYSDLDPALMPPIKCLVMANADADLAAALAAKMTMPMPFAAVEFKGSVSQSLTDLKDH